jgi:nucleoside-diphosphate-sugar epimerase
MNILVTGSGGSLGKAICLSLLGQGVNVVKASSKHDLKQNFFDLNKGFNHSLLSDIDLILHLSINPELKLTNIESEFIKIASREKITIIYLGSTSSYLVEPNSYGKYKKSVEDQVLENDGIVVTCGLIYGKNFRGQISRLRAILRKLPFKIKIKGSKMVLLTPMQAIISLIMEFEELEFYKSQRVLLFHKTEYSFNDLLSELSGKKLLTLKLNGKSLSYIFKIIPFTHRYFSSDSYLGVLSDFKTDLQESALDLSKKVDDKFSLKLY